jgi:microcystin-dependent protein
VISLTAGSTTVPVCLPSLEQRKVFDRLFADGGVSELTDPATVWAEYAHDWPTLDAPRWVAPKLGRLHWPLVGASRYAHAVYLLHEADWFALAGQVESGETVTVSFEDGPDAGETPRTVPMKLLCARPLVRLNEGETPVGAGEPGDAWFVVLVDPRYFALREVIASAGSASDGSGSGAGGDGGGTRTFFSWADLFAALSVTVASAVLTEYGAPDTARWTEARMRGRSAAVLADIAAALVGSRIVTGPGASAQLQRPTLGRATELETAYTAAQTANRVVWGGPIEVEGAAVECPTAVRGVFLAPNDSRVQTLESATTGYTAWAGARAMGTALDPAVHQTETVKQTALDQWADDFCAWRFGMFSCALAGVHLPPANGFCWAFTIDSDRETLRTRWERPPVLHGWLARASASEASNDQPKFPTGENQTGSGCSIPAGSGSGGATGLAWYTRYLHLAGVEVSAGQTLSPGQRIGVLARFAPGGVSHLHHALTDGGDPFLWPETDFPTAGVSLDIDDWLGLPVLGTRTGATPPRAGRFDAGQLAEIEARYRSPVDENPRWRTVISSNQHRLYDYYAVDLALISDDPYESAGAPVYAAVGGNDVLTEVMWTGFRGEAGWGVLLRHRLCGAPDAGDSGDDQGATPPGGDFSAGGDFDGDPHTVNRGGLLDVVTRVCIGPLTAGTLVGRDTEAGDGPMQEICLDPDSLAIINGVLTATASATVADGSVTNAKLADMATARIKGRVTAGTGVPEDLTGTQATTLLDVFTSSLKGLVPASGGGTANFLRADGTFAAPVVPDAVPAGTIVAYGGTTVPSGYLEAAGGNVSRTTYAALFTAIGTLHGAGDGSTTFGLPSFARRTLVGRGGSGTATLGNTVGNTGGSETHTLSTAELAAHTHSLPSASATLGAGTTGYSSVGTTNAISAFSTTSGSSGSGSAHNNLQPSLVVMFLIKV